MDGIVILGPSHWNTSGTKAILFQCQAKKLKTDNKEVTMLNPGYKLWTVNKSMALLRFCKKNLQHLFE